MAHFLILMDSGNKKEKVKIYVTIGLAIVLVLSGYFRLIHGKTKAQTPYIPPSQKVGGSLSIPRVESKMLQKTRSMASVDKYLNAGIRDIFAEPLKPIIPKEEPEPVVEEPIAEEPKPPPPPPGMLKGTIVGGENPIAIIDDQFVHLGDWIGEYQVVKIAKREVHLNSGEYEVVLQVMESLK